MDVQSLSLVLAQALGKKLSFNKDQVDVMRYGFEVIIGTFIKITILLSVAYVLNLFSYILVILVTSGIYRLLPGGVHCTSYNRCLIFGIILYFSLAMVAKTLPVPPRPYMLLLLLGLTVFSLLISLKYAPAETENKPISQLDKNKLKKLTIAWIGLWFVVTFSCIMFGSPKAIGSLIMVSILAHLTQTLSLTPAGYRAVGYFDSIMRKVL